MKPNSAIDDFIISLDQTLSTVFGRPPTTQRPYPAEKLEASELTETEKQAAIRLMRINHVGEVCAQALYQSQALTSNNPTTKEQMRKSADEENDHLNWCETRINELGGRKSLLNPVWYAGSFALGGLAGLAGDRWNLGFVAETEKQVVRHLESHLRTISPNDHRSRAIIEQMKTDEGEHEVAAINAGGAELPEVLKSGMSMMSKIMTKTAHWL